MALDNIGQLLKRSDDVGRKFGFVIGKFVGELALFEPDGWMAAEIPVLDSPKHAVINNKNFFPREVQFQNGLVQNRVFVGIGYRGHFKKMPERRGFNNPYSFFKR